MDTLIVPSTGPATIDLIALRAMTTAIRCREIGGGLVTLRRTVTGVVPGQQLTVRVERRWTFRRTDMVGGPVTDSRFSLRGLWLAGLAVPEMRAGTLRDPAEDDPRLREALFEMETGAWASARCVFLDILEDRPGCLVAHAAMGEILFDLAHVEDALAHCTAAVRLGMGGLTTADSLPLRGEDLAPRSLLRALRLRANALLALGRPLEAATDLRRALTWDPTDNVGARGLLDQIESPAPRNA